MLDVARWFSLLEALQNPILVLVCGGGVPAGVNSMCCNEDQFIQFDPRLYGRVHVPPAFPEVTNDWMRLAKSASISNALVNSAKAPPPHLPRPLTPGTHIR